ncbi:putative ribosomal protein L2 [Helianthus annuus]|nr:putative ribosomal protein L2 [Helianthus annuus]
MVKNSLTIFLWVAKEGKSATLKLPSGEVRLISKNCSATVGQVGNVGVNQKNLVRAGSKRWLGKIQVIKAQVSFGSQLQYDPHASLAHTAPERIPMVKKINPRLITR